MIKYLESPHREESSPTVFASYPIDATPKHQTGAIASTDNKPSPRQQGEAVASPWFGQGGDGALR